MRVHNISRSDYRTSLILVTPATIAVLVFLVYPFVYTLLLSLSKINLSNNQMTFIGLQNFTRLLRQKAFGESVVRTLKFALVSTALSSGLGVGFALFLNSVFAGRGFARGILIIPWSVPWVVIGILWTWMLNSNFGLINGILYQFGLIKEYFPFLGNMKTILYYTTIPGIWRQASFSAILLLASIQTVPEELYEAATIDGANIFQKTFSITIPWMLPTLMIVSMINTLYGLMQFDTVFIMTQGGPANASEIISIHMYKTAFEKLNLGEGAAIGYMLTLISVVLGVMYVRVLNRIEKRY
jgi:multiple sugar transport system permease protein